jgi:hypothetical protein
MDLDDRHLGSVVVDVSIEGDQARLVRFDRFHESPKDFTKSWSFPSLSRCVPMKMNGLDIHASSSRRRLS